MPGGPFFITLLRIPGAGSRASCLLPAQPFPSSPLPLAQPHAAASRMEAAPAAFASAPICNAAEQTPVEEYPGQKEQDGGIAVLFLYLFLTALPSSRSPD